MDISISEEQNQLIEITKKNVIPLLVGTGNCYPTIFVHTGSSVRYFQFQTGMDLESLRELALKTIREKCSEVLAYALAYDTCIEIDGSKADALIIESGDEEEAEAIEFAITYSRTEGQVEPLRPIAKMQSLLNEKRA